MAALESQTTKYYRPQQTTSETKYHHAQFMSMIRWWLEVTATHRARLPQQEVIPRRLEAGGQDGLAEAALVEAAPVAAPLEAVEVHHHLAVLVTMAMTMETTTGIEM
jgi:hypothetical protein